jgi:predicted P-loop ATPase
MSIEDSAIVTFDYAALFNQANIMELMDIQEPEERARKIALMEGRARAMGLEKAFRGMIRAYNKAEKSIANEYKREFARQKAQIPLEFDGTGRPMSTVENFLRVLEGDPKFSGLKFNLLTYSPEQVRNGVTERWLDADDAETRRYIEQEYKFHSVQKCDDALRIVFAKNQYHPIRDLVNSFVWDGTPRITEFLTRWTKCEDTPYTREVSRLIFAGGIHRLYNPGCKFDDMPVLIGTKQGEGKSTLVRWLALRDEYFTEVNEFDGQRGIEAVEGAWICEVSELLAMTKAKEQEAIKSYLTRLNDRYRMPFDKRVTDHPRQCVFIGTTNKEQFLTDKTGNRRFYPVKVRQSGYELFDHEAEIKPYIEQCWAEAKALYDKGEIPPYADRKLVAEIRQMQDEATEDDYRVGLIQSYLENKSVTCVLDLWKNALGCGDFVRPSKKDSQEIGMIMQSIPGWVKHEKFKRFDEFGVQRYWAREGQPNTPNIDDLEDELPL